MREGKATVASRARIPDDETLRRITTRAVAEIVPHQEFVEGLQSGRALRLKMGFDPTRPVITLGWAVGLRKLRQLPHRRSLRPVPDPPYARRGGGQGQLGCHPAPVLQDLGPATNGDPPPVR